MSACNIFLCSNLDYLGNSVAPFRESIMKLPDLVSDGIGGKSCDWSVLEALICHVINMSHMSAAYVLQAKATSNTSPDIELGECEYYFFILHLP